MSIKTFTLIKQHNNWLHWAVSALFCIENEFWENIWISDWSVNCWKPWLEPSCAKVQLENLNWSSRSNLEVNVESSLLTKVVGQIHYHKSTLWQSQQAQIDEGETCTKYQGKWRGGFSFWERNHGSKNQEQIWQMEAFPDSRHYERPRMGGPPTNRPPWLLHWLGGRECRGRGDPYQGRLLAPLSALKPSSTCRVRIVTQMVRKTVSRKFSCKKRLWVSRFVCYR